MELGEKVFVVTGAGSGMGRQLTIELVRRGARVAAVDMRAATLDETKALTGSDVATFVLDVTDADAVAALPERVINALGAVDGLINNAGIVRGNGYFWENNATDVELTMQVNSIAPMLIAREFLPGMVELDTDCRVVTIASSAGLVSTPRLAQDTRAASSGASGTK